MRHPNEEILLEHAGGELDLAMRVVVAAHLDLCPGCAAVASGLAAPGGWRLGHDGAPRETPPPALWERIEAEVAAGAAPGAAVPAAIPLPPAARAELPGGARPRWWSLGLGGARMAHLATDPVTGAHLLLGRMPGGRRFPWHEHLGSEHATVLAGGYDDEGGEHLAGDFAVYDPGSAHGPQTLDGDSCWLVVRLAGSVRFRGWRGALQRIAGVR